MDFVKRLISASKELNALAGDTYAKGDLFEVYVQRLFHESDFRCLHATPRRGDLDGRIIESAKNPDFKFRHKRSEHEFWVECKYRRDLFDDKLVWCRADQLKRYKEFQETERPHKFYVVIGFGGRPSKPELMFNVPLDEIEYCGIYSGILEKYERDPTKPFDYQKGRLI